MKWAAPGPVPTPSSSAPAAAVSQTTGPVTATTTAGITAMRTPPAEEEWHVRTAVLPFRALFWCVANGCLEKKNEMNKKPKKGVEENP